MEQGRPLYFCPVVSFIFFFFLSSSPVLSCRRLDVCHNSTRGVALVQICDAGLKCAAYNSLKIQDAKKNPKIHHLRTITKLCRVISSQLRHVSTIKKLVKQQYLHHMASQYGELWPTSG